MEPSSAEPLIDRVTQFCDRLRQLGIPVSTSEILDAGRVLTFVDWRRRAQFKSALSAATVKNSAHVQTFDLLFDIYFPESPAALLDPYGPEAALDDMTPDLLDALKRMDIQRIDELAAEAIRRYAGFEQGRPVGGRYYQWKVEQALGMSDLEEMLGEMLGGGSGRLTFVANQDAQARVVELRRRIERLIRSRLISERGSDAMVRALVRPLPDEVEFLQASSEDLAEMKRVIEILARRLASRLSYKHHRSRRGKLDFRRTIRKSLETGGVPVTPTFRHRVNRPELTVICDISGSVAAFSRFALSLLYALNQHFNKIRSFAFVDTVDEVTSFFEGSDFDEAMRRLKSEAHVVWLDGHSDYGHSLKEFSLRYSDAVTPRTTVLLLGDVRSNFRQPETGALQEIANKCRKLYLLNPEPHRHWDTGDSIVRSYEPYCDGVFECRSLRQLSAFIERIG